MRIGFLTECVGINRGDTPRVPKAPRGVPEVDPDTRGGWLSVKAFTPPCGYSSDVSLIGVMIIRQTKNGDTR